MTVEEIEEKYPGEWIVLVDVEEDAQRVRAGIVHAHSPDKRAALAASRGLRDIAFFSTGKIASPLLHYMMKPLDVDG